MVAFQGAIGLGYRYLETDVHVTRDDVVVVFHDDRLERLTNGSGNVADWRWADLETLDAAYTFDADSGYPLRGKGIGMPTLEELARTFPDAMINIDLKQDGIAERVAVEVDRLGLSERVMVGSFHGKRIARFRLATGGAVATSAGPAEVAAAVAGRADAGAADAFQVPEGGRGVRIVTRRFVDRVHAAGKQVHVWTVNDAGSMHRLLDLGVDGIVTDRPDLLNDVLAARS